MYRLTSNSIVARNQAILAAEVLDEVVALDMERGAYFGLNPVGTRVWALIAEPSRVSGICDVLVAEYEVDRATCEDQVLDLLNEMRTEGMVTVHEQPAFETA